MDKTYTYLPLYLSACLYVSLYAGTGIQRDPGGVLGESRSERCENGRRWRQRCSKCRRHEYRQRSRARSRSRSRSQHYRCKNEGATETGRMLQAWEWRSHRRRFAPSIERILQLIQNIQLAAFTCLPHEMWPTTWNVSLAVVKMTLLCC